MSTSAVSANVWASGAGPEARCDQKECLSSRLVPLGTDLLPMSPVAYEDLPLLRGTPATLAEFDG